MPLDVHIPAAAGGATNPLTLTGTGSTDAALTLSQTGTTDAKLILKTDDRTWYIGNDDTDDQLEFGTGSETVGSGTVVMTLDSTGTLLKPVGDIEFGNGAANQGFLKSGAAGDLLMRTSGTGLGISFRPNNTETATCSHNGTNGSFLFVDGTNIVFQSTNGTKIGTATTQKLAFYNSTPIVQGAAVADAAGGTTIDAEARTALNALLARIRSLGLIAT